MSLPDAINDHVRALPVNLQREALDFAASLERRYHIQPRAGGGLTTEAFIERLAGSLGDDFPDAIGDSGWAGDTAREAIKV